MIKQESHPLLHWNYFTAIEADVLRLSRFIELDKRNYRTYSIEIVRIYLSACSEVDVVSRQLVELVDSNVRAENIRTYRDVLRPRFPVIERTKVRIPRHGLLLRPWSNWKKDETPRWWSDHQSVKHKRAQNYELANLQNMLNSVAGLLVIIIVYYRFLMKEAKLLLRPIPVLFEPDRELAYVAPIFGASEALVVNEAS
mgnify:CR=1 FL=1